MPYRLMFSAILLFCCIGIYSINNDPIDVLLTAVFGFVGYVFKDKLGFLLPRKATQMSRVGKPINREELQPGDLVFFNTMRLTFSHVGIYVGDNKFIHSPSKGTTVRVDDLGSLYWDKRFDGARRLDGSDNLNDAERQDLLNEVKNLKRKSRNL